MFINMGVKPNNGLVPVKDGYMKVPLCRAQPRASRTSPEYEYCHRLVLYFIFGPPPSTLEGPFDCCHICCNYSCLNPFHLVWGTRKHNVNNQMADYIHLATEQGHPEDTIPRERPAKVV